MTATIKLLASATALGLAACGSEADQPAAENSSLETVNADDNVTATAPAAQAFVDAAGASDLYEIEAGRIGAEKATDPEVKEYAAMLVTDHGKSSTDMKAAAAQAGPGLVPPAALPTDKQAMIDALNAASGADFDRLFLEQQVAAHTAALDVLQSYASSGEAEPLKAFAAATAPVVQAHLEKARSLQE